MTRDPFERVNEDEDLSNVAEFPALSSYTSSTLSAEHKLRIASSKRGDPEGDTQLRPVAAPFLGPQSPKCVRSSHRADLKTGQGGLCVRASPNGGAFVAVGCRDGTVRVYRTPDAKHFRSVIMSKDSGIMSKHVRKDSVTYHVAETLPATELLPVVFTLGGAKGSVSYVNVGAAHAPAEAVARAESPSAVAAVEWRPGAEGSSNMLMVAKGEQLLGFHVTTGKLMTNVTEAGNSILAIAAARDGSCVATGGSDGIVRVYNSSGGTLQGALEFGSAGSEGHGHSNRVFCVAFHPDDSNVLFSGGWDRTVQVWDVRTRRSVRSIFSPYLCGAALAVHKDTLATASWRPGAPVQLWDWRTGDLLTNVPVHAPRGHPLSLYAAAFAAGGRCLVTGGSGKAPAIEVLSTAGEVLAECEFGSDVHAVDVIGEGLDGGEGGLRLAVCCADSLELVNVGGVPAAMHIE